MHKDLWSDFKTWVNENKSQDTIRYYKPEKLARFMKD
jgi:hypothetical protein